MESELQLKNLNISTDGLSKEEAYQRLEKAKKLLSTSHSWKEFRDSLPESWLPINLPSEEEIKDMTIPQLSFWLEERGLSKRGAYTKEDLISIISNDIENIKSSLKNSKDLISVLEKVTSYKERPKYYSRLVTPNLTKDIMAGNYYSGIAQTPVDYIMITEINPNDILFELLYPPEIISLDYISKINILWWNYSLDINLPNYSRLGEFSKIQEALEMPEDMTYFFLLHGVLPPFINPINLELPIPTDVSKVSRYLWQSWNAVDQGKLITPLSPYQIFMSHSWNPLYPVIYDWDENPRELADEIGMVIPSGVNPTKYFLKNINKYKTVITEEAPPDSYLIAFLNSRGNIKEWKSRKEILTRIDYYMVHSFWRSIFDLQLGKDSLCYGNFNNFLCMGPEDSMFSSPWGEINLLSMLQLKKFLIENPSEEFISLLPKIEEGIRYKFNQERIIDNLRDEYQRIKNKKAVQESLLSLYFEKPKLTHHKKWLLSLPYVNYDFTNKTVSFGKETIGQAIQKGKSLYESGYYLSLTILNISSQDLANLACSTCQEYDTCEGCENVHPFDPYQNFTIVV